MAHIVLIGYSGYVGCEFARQINARGHRATHLGRANCNLYNASDIARRIASVQADFVINCAGYTGKPNVDACEVDKANCLAANAVLPGVISAACGMLEVPWGHVSSGCIFTGSHRDGSGFTEEDQPNFTFRQNNCSYYSGTKALGEEILEHDDRCYIWRLRIPFSHVDSPRNYLTKIFQYERLLEAENSLSNLNEFVAAALDSFERKLAFGIYNLTNPGYVRTSEVVEMMLDAGVHDREFQYFASEAEFRRTVAKTPRSNCILDSSKAVRAGLSLTPVRILLEQNVREWCGNQICPSAMGKTEAQWSRPYL